MTLKAVRYPTPTEPFDCSAPRLSPAHRFRKRLPNQGFSEAGQAQHAPRGQQFLGTFNANFTPLTALSVWDTSSARE